MPTPRLIVIVVALLPAAARSADWPMYGRDPTRNAASPEKNPPVDWQIGERDVCGTNVTDDRNVKWRAAIGTHTFGAPTVANGFVWVCTNNERPRPVYVPNEDGRVVILPLAREPGKPLAEVEFHSAIYSSPVFANGVLYVTTRDALYAIAPRQR